MFEITEAARAEMAKRRKRDRDEHEHHGGGTPLHAQAEGHREYEERRKRDDESLKTSRHPGSGRFVPDPQHPYLFDGHAADSPGNGPATPRPATSWPGTDAHAASDQGVRLTQVGDRRAALPSPQTTISTAGAPMPSGPAFTPGTASVQHLDLTTGSPLRPQTSPARPAFQTAPINTEGR